MYLSLYSAVIESRRIFRKLKSYVVYRFAATMQIVIVLTLLIYISDCPINSLYIILLALFNDLTMLPIAYDRQNASATPENPDVVKILLLSCTLGAMETMFSLLWAYASYKTHIFDSNFDIFECGTKAQSGVWIQMSVAAELLIFSARAPSYIWTSILPSPALFCSVILGCLIISILACAVPFFGGVSVRDCVIIWCYDIMCLIVIDCIKVMYFNLMQESSSVLVDADTSEPTLVEHVSAKLTGAGDKTKTPVAVVKDVEMGGDKGDHFDDSQSDASNSRANAMTQRMAKWKTTSSANIYSIGASSTDIIGDANRSMSTANINTLRKGSNAAIIAAVRSKSTANATSAIGAANASATRPAAPATVDVLAEGISNGGKISVSHSHAMQGSSTDLRRHISSASLRPHTPANAAAAYKRGKY